MKISIAPVYYYIYGVRVLFPGIISRLPYLLGLGVEAVMVSSLHASPATSSNAGVLDYHTVNPILGTMDDFQSLITQLHDKGQSIGLNSISKSIYKGL